MVFRFSSNYTIYSGYPGYPILVFRLLQIIPSPTSHEQNMSWVTASGTPRASRSSTVSTILPWKHQSHWWNVSCNVVSSKLNQKGHCWGCSSNYQ